MSGVECHDLGVVPEGVSWEWLVERVQALEAQVTVLREQNLALETRNAELEARNAELTRQNAQLSRRLGQNSQNSSKPPSSDGPEHKPPPRSLRTKTGRRPGKQPGAPGTTLRLVDDPDRIVDHVPESCSGCGNALTDVASVAVVRRQVTDIAPAVATVTEHRLHRRRCACGTLTTAPPPAGVAEAPASYGPNLRAWVVYLLVFQHVPVARVVELIGDLTGARPSTGWVCQVLRETAAGLADVEQLIRALLVLAPVLHVDETGTKVGGQRWWLHVACTDTLTTYHVDAGRGRPAINTLGILEQFTGTAVHDCWLSYDGYPDCTHALCGAHIARELVAASESHPDQDWPTRALDALFALNRAAEAARAEGRAHITDKVADPLVRAWRDAITDGLTEHPRKPGRKQSMTHNLLIRVRDREADLLRFTRDTSVPFTNNQAERDLRPVKTQIKISGTSRSDTSAQAWARIRGYISTARKHGIGAFDAIHAAILGNPWTPPQPATT